MLLAGTLILIFPKYFKSSVWVHKENYQVLCGSASLWDLPLKEPSKCDPAYDKNSPINIYPLSIITRLSFKAHMFIHIKHEL